MISEQYHCLRSVHVGRMVFIISLEEKKACCTKRKIVIYMTVLRDIIMLSISTANLGNYVFMVDSKKYQLTYDRD